MREATVHVPVEALEPLGFDAGYPEFRDVEVQDISLVSHGESICVAAVTYSEPVDDALENADRVTWWERLERDGPGTSYLCRTEIPNRPARGRVSPDEAPVVRALSPSDRGFTLNLLGDPAAFQCGEGIDEGDRVPVSLRQLRDYEGPGHDLDALTDRQRAVLETAFERGYYDVPRETTADEIAREFDLDRSTVTEHLQRAERNLLSTVLSE